MAAKPQIPQVETWYETGGGDIFEVVAVEDDAVEIQYLDGTVEELDRDEWESVAPRAIDIPDDMLADEDQDTERRRPRHADEDGASYHDDWSNHLDDE